MSREQALESIRAGLTGLADANNRIKVAGVDVQGRCATPLVEAYIQPLFAANSVDTLVKALNKVQTDLYSLGVYKDVTISITPSRIVEIKLLSNNKFVARVGTNIGQSEGSGYIRGTVCNYTNWGEILTVDTSAGTRTRSSHLADLSVPLPFPWAVGWKAEVLAYSSEKAFEWSSAKAYVKGFGARLTQGRNSSFGIDSVLRSLHSTKTAGNPALTPDFGTSFKSSVFYNWRKDTRRPTTNIPGDGQGWMLDVQNELTLRPTTAPFFKFFAQFHSAFPLIARITAAFNGKFGILTPLDGKSSHFLDRFTLGGPLDLRGFRLNHAGPHAYGDAVGGNIVAATGVSIFTPLPRVESPNLKFHSFLNAGVLRLPVTGSQWAPSVSTGFGIAYTHPSARFELNIVVPLVSRVSELVHKGLQFGVGLEFM